jgi:digeranylgeranylglycerophospholipid reductase
VVDRGILDLEMAGAAANAGAEFRTKTAVRGLGDGTVQTRGVHRHEEFMYRLLIAADGPRSTIARIRGLERAKVYLAGIQADVPYEMDGRFVEIYPDASPEFFGWAIPLGSGRARVGLCGLTNVKERFSTFLGQFGGSCIHFVTGTLPLGVMPKTFGDRILYVGDAAGFAKPTSGGGVYTGVRSARHAAAVAIECSESGSFDDGALSRYEHRWQADIGRELATGMRLWHIRQRMTPEDIDALCRALDDPGVLQVIREYGDMDRPSALVKRLCMKPAVFRLLGIILRSGVRGIRK